MTNTPRGSTTYDERKKLLREISRLKKQSTRFKTLVEETEQKIFAIEEKFGVEDFYCIQHLKKSGNYKLKSTS